jgi:hypothetical protein
MYWDIIHSTLELAYHSHTFGIIKLFFNSVFFQTIFTLAGILIAAILGLKSFFGEQKTKRLEKLYFNDTFVRYSNILDANIQITKSNLHNFSNALDYIQNLSERGDQDSLLSFMNQLMTDTKPPVAIGIVVGQINFIFVNRSKHLTQWIAKIQNDYEWLHSRVEGQLKLLYKEIERNTKFTEIQLKEINDAIRPSYLAAQRHYIFQNLFDSLVRKFAELDFRNAKSINKFTDNADIKKIINQIDESFEVLFGFYQSAQDNNIWYSYAQELNGERFKLNFLEKDNQDFLASIEKIQIDINPPNTAPTMILFDQELGSIKIDGIPFPQKLVNMAYLKIGISRSISPAKQKFTDSGSIKDFI